MRCAIFLRTLFVPGIAVDWINSNMYWTDQETPGIWAARTDGTHQYLLFKNPQVTRPHAIAVDPFDRSVGAA